MNTEAMYKVKWTRNGEAFEQTCHTNKDLKELVRKLWLREITYRIQDLQPRDKERKCKPSGTPEPCTGDSEAT